MNGLNRDTQRLILNLTCRSSCIADIVEVTSCSPNTVRRHLARCGEAFIASHDRLVRGFSPVRIEVDELWSYVYAKRGKNISRSPGKRPAPADYGAYYTWIGFDPDSKIIVSWQVGDRTEKTGIPFLVDLNSRITGRVLITTDGFNFYRDAIKKIFGDWALHVVMEKDIESWRNPETGERGTRFKKLDKLPQSSEPVDLSLASTSLIERLNASLRNYNSRLTRQTYKFSKRLPNHIYAQAIFVMCHNFVRQHGGLKGPERHWTPAMKAGLTDRPWSYDDLLDEVDRYWEHKALQPVLQIVPPRPYVPLKAGEISPLPYFVVYSPMKREAKVHKGGCRSCRQGAGRKDGGSKNRWYAFATEREARRCAESLAPMENSVCSICVIGHYVKHRVRSR